jgi:ectoine hydroxylase-related dioxygenase (phytanoyl-CoA dioxygenase family)
MAKEVIGDNAFPYRATLFDKSADANWLVVWHQDTALPLKEQHDVPGWGPWSVKNGIKYAHAPAGALEQVLAVRVHLNDSTSENGPLRVLPGTHNRGVLTDDAIHELTEQIEAEELVVDRGGVF